MVKGDVPEKILKNVVQTWVRKEPYLLCTVTNGTHLRNSPQKSNGNN